MVLFEILTFQLSHYTVARVGATWLHTMIIFASKLAHTSYKYYYSGDQTVYYHDGEQTKAIMIANTIMIIAQP